ncbi:hypothetical protein JOD45_000165 [Scopulibacillus daqui]|uniref:Uncharacterized protein n=1 Tax=Scopulibacillus daqui TaxID=1469162 RepID=A0ABS2PV92_9BACL|nr:hypothetical protein [Scopulibacillus daqui]MBM7643974.1 hypothetical protein [Scopulibacillus daqui]
MNEYIILTNKEIYVLQSMIEAPVIIGMENPFLGLLGKEIEEEWKNTVSGLIEKGFIGIDNESAWIDEDLIIYMSIMANTNVVLQIDSPDEQLPLSIFYFTEEYTVECEQINHNLYKLSRRGSPSETFQHVILPKLGIDQLSISKKGRLLLPGHFVNDFCKINRIPESLVNQINQLNKTEQGRKLWKDLKKSLDKADRFRGMMFFFYHHDQWSVEGLITLFSPVNNWGFKMVNINNKEYLEAEQVDLIGMTKEYISVIDRAVSGGKSLLWN